MKGQYFVHQNRVIDRTLQIGKLRITLPTETNYEMTNNFKNTFTKVENGYNSEDLMSFDQEKRL